MRCLEHVMGRALRNCPWPTRNKMAKFSVDLVLHARQLWDHVRAEKMAFWSLLVFLAFSTSLLVVDAKATNVSPFSARIRKISKATYAFLRRTASGNNQIGSTRWFC